MSDVSSGEGKAAAGFSPSGAGGQERPTEPLSSGSWREEGAPSWRWGAQLPARRGTAL